MLLRHQKQVFSGNLTKRGDATDRSPLWTPAFVHHARQCWGRAQRDSNEAREDTSEDSDDSEDSDAAAAPAGNTPDHHTNQNAGVLLPEASEAKT